MVDYKVFFVAWTSAVVAQCVSTNNTNVNNVELWAFLAGSAVVAGMFHNWFWRLVVFGVAWTMNETRVVVSLSSSAAVHLLPSTYLCAVCLWMMLHTAPTWYIPRIFRPLQQIEGAVFVTGADNGMGFRNSRFCCIFSCSPSFSFSLSHIQTWPPNGPAKPLPPPCA